MAQSESNRISLKISEETTWGETPSSPAMTRIPYLSDSLVHDKRTVQSNVLRSDAMRDGQVEVGVSAGGEIPFELRFTDFQTLFKQALRTTWQTATKTGAGTTNDLAFAAAGGGVQVITGPSGWTDDFDLNAWVRVKSAAQAANNGIFKISAKNATTLTISNSAGVIEADSTAVITMKYLRNGTTKQSVLIEKAYEDLSNTYEYFTGMRVAGFSLNVQTEQIVTGTFRFMGKQGFTSTATVSGSIVAASNNDSMNASVNVGNILENGASLSTALKSITLDYNNNPRALAGIGNKAAIGVNLGSIEITGRVEAYFENLTLLDKVRNHTVSGLSFRMTDPAGNVMIFNVGRLYFTGNPTNPGINQDAMLPLDYSAEREQTDSFMLQIDALAA